MNFTNKLNNNQKINYSYFDNIQLQKPQVI